jgi:hypothetical protein
MNKGQASSQKKTLFCFDYSRQLHTRLHLDFRLLCTIVSLVMAPTFAAIFGLSKWLGPEWLNSSGFPVSDDGLHYLVVTDGSSALTVSKARQLYCHWMMRTAMDKTVGGYYQEPVELNRLLEARVARMGSHVGDHLSLFQLARIGDILLVLMSYMSAGPSQPPG